MALRSSSEPRILRIGAEQLLGLDQLVGHEPRHRLLGIAGRHLDRLLVAGLDAGEQTGRPGERRQDGALGQSLQAVECCCHDVSSVRVADGVSRAAIGAGIAVPCQGEREGALPHKARHVATARLRPPLSSRHLLPGSTPPGSPELASCEVDPGDKHDVRKRASASGFSAHAARVHVEVGFLLLELGRVLAGGDVAVRACACGGARRR